MSSEEGGHATTSSSSLCPSKSTVYLGNINYTLTNNDLIKILEHCGKVVCAKIVKDKVTRKSKGYAFIQFLKSEDAQKCVEEYDGTQMFGRKWMCSIALDNGRTSEFIRKRVYPDKSRCYECGEFGHLSYKCPKNALGDREPPPKKKKKQKPQDLSASSPSMQGDNTSSSESVDEDVPDEILDESLNAAINYQRQMAEEQEYREAVSSGDYKHLQTFADKTERRPKYVQDGYFSDEEALVDDIHG